MAVVAPADQYPTPPDHGQANAEVLTSFRAAGQCMWTIPPFPHISRLRGLSGAGITPPGAYPERYHLTPPLTDPHPLSPQPLDLPLSPHLSSPPSLSFQDVTASGGSHPTPVQTVVSQWLPTRGRPSIPEKMS
jgi:hypothetical protein